MSEYVLANMKICLYFLPFLDAEMAQAIEILPHGRRGPVYILYTYMYIVSTVTADGLVTQGAMASAAMVLTLPSWNIPVLEPEGLTYWPLGDLNEILAN